MIPEHFSMVRHKNHQGIFRLTGLLQRFENSSDLIVDQGNHSQVSGTYLFTVKIGHFRGVKFSRIVVGPDSIFFLKAGLGPFLIWMCGWQRHILNPEAGEVIGGRVKGMVWIKAIETEEPRNTLFFANEFDGFFGTPSRLMKFRGWTFFYEWADFFAL